MTVPAFIAKLWHMVSDQGLDDLICWSEDGASFFIKDQVRFCSQLLPRYYKHDNMASFIRQLNNYGFHKKSSIESSSITNYHEFAHEFFTKDGVTSLEMIKRRMKTTSSKQQTRGVNFNRSRGVSIKDLHQTLPTAIEVKKKKMDAPVISEIEHLVDQPDTSSMLFTASESPGEPATLEITSLIGGIQSQDRHLISFNTDLPFPSKVNLTVGRLQDDNSSISTSTTTGSSKRNATGKEDNADSKKPMKLNIPTVVQKEKVDLRTDDTTLVMDEPDPSSTTDEPKLLDYQRQNNKRKALDNSSSLVLSDVGSELENHLGLETSAFMYLFSGQVPIGLSMPEASYNKQQLDSICPDLTDITDMLLEEDGDELPLPSPIDTTATDFLLNTPQPSPNAGPNFTPKRFKE